MRLFFITVALLLFSWTGSVEAQTKSNQKRRKSGGKDGNSGGRRGTASAGLRSRNKAVIDDSRPGPIPDISAENTFKANSTAFTLPDINFECPQAECLFANLMENTVFHMVVGVEHDHYFPLLVHRVCEAFQKCIKPEMFRIVLQVSDDSDNSRAKYRPAVKFMQRLGVRFTLWVGTFTADSKMVRSFDALAGDKDRNTFVYQTDFDEVPDPITFNRALKELQSGSCDAVKGKWLDRLAVGGKLNDIVLEGSWSLGEQFPLRCRISGNFVGSRIEKVLVYNSLYRLDGGHHEIWCSPLSGAGHQKVQTLRWAIEEEEILAFNNMSNPADVANNTATYAELCDMHITGRGKGTYRKEIKAAMSTILTPARYCKTTVIIDHFKFVGGIQQYLDNRWRTYKKNNLHWWRDSYKMLVHIERNNGTMCTTCSSSKCVDTQAHNRRVEADPEKVFYCGRHNEECLPLHDKKGVERIKANLGRLSGHTSSASMVRESNLAAK